MFYNWKCCSFYPNNFGASALYYVLDVFIYQTLKSYLLFSCKNQKGKTAFLLNLSFLCIYFCGTRINSVTSTFKS